MAGIATNAPFTNQGRADLQRTPTESQIAFNQSQSSAISVVSAATLAAFAEGVFEPELPLSVTINVDTGSEIVTVNRRLCLFLWMTDRITAVSAKQFQYVEGKLSPLSFFAGPVLPTNGFAILPAGATCTPNGATDVGTQSTLAYASGSLRFSVRGTPLLLYMESTTGELEETVVAVDALSESLLSGRSGSEVREFRNGTFNAYTGDAVSRSQIILFINDYLAGQYWNQNNVLVDGANQYDIVGVWSDPPYFAPLEPPQ
jgi:hypothetical protein